MQTDPSCIRIGQQTSRQRIIKDGLEITPAYPCPKDLLMSIEHYTRRRFNSLIASAPFWPLAAKASAARARELLITKSGAVPDDFTVNTKTIQAAIDQLAAKGGGT